MKYRHFSVEEREKIQVGLWEKKSVRAIAQELNRSPASVSREIRRNLPLAVRRYTPRTAHSRALAFRKRRGRTERLKNNAIREYVVSRLKHRWSPEQIAGRITEEIGETISHEAIYQYVYAQIHRHGHGPVKPGREDLRMCLRRRRKRRMRKGLRTPQRIPSFEGVSIDFRPAVVAERSRAGDWESDTIESVNRRPGVNTCVERKTGLVLISKLKNKKSEATVEAIVGRMAEMPRQTKHTITFDNGPENSRWRELEEATGLTAFFAHQYHSWERGTNENTNGLIRDYFPKKTDFTTISEYELAYVERELNSRPRKRLGWKTPLEAWSVALQS